MKIYLDCASLTTMMELAPEVQGFTTNPTLMRQAGVHSYELFAKAALREIELPISFEVIADTFPEMERQAHLIQSWGENAWVKIPITNTKGEWSLDLVEKLVTAGVAVNITAVMTDSQIDLALDRFSGEKIILSIFAGRIADTGVDPVPMIAHAVVEARSPAQILWASTRELLNIGQAEDAGCHIITVSPELLRQRGRISKSLKAYSLETVQQFYEDAQKAGYTL